MLSGVIKFEWAQTSFLTHLFAKAVPLKVLMELAGHRQAQTTPRYINVTSDMKRATVQFAWNTQPYI